MNKQDLVKILVENFTIDNKISIRGLDFSDYEEIESIDFSGIKGNIDIYQGYHKNDGYIDQSEHKNCLIYK